MADAAADGDEQPSLVARLSDAATVGSYRAGSAFARALPAAVAAGLANPLGAGAQLASPRRRAMIERHLRRANPQWSRWRVRAAVQDAFESYVRYWIESARLPSLPPHVVDAGMELDGFEHVTAALEAGNGVILALPHLGGWEWAGRWLVDQGHRVTVVVEKVDPPELFDWFTGQRARLGMTVVSLGPEAGRATLRALRANEVVCLLSDRDIGGGGVEVEFFGERTTLPGGPATLGLRTGAPILPTGVYFTRRTNGHFGLVRPPLTAQRQASLRDDVARVTQHLAAELEQLIRRAPEQWHLFVPNWPSDPGYGE